MAENTDVAQMVHATNLLDKCEDAAGKKKFYRTPECRLV